jgi:hypothetical protein
MNGYELSRNFVDFSFENPSKIKPNHYALYFFSVEHCNRLGWKKEFGLPTTMTMEAIGIKSYASYIKTFNELVDLGFFILVERSKNQYSSNIIELSKNVKALDKALDKAFVKHASKQQESTHESIDSINKPITIEPINKDTKVSTSIDFDKLLIAFNQITNKNCRVVNSKTRAQLKARLKDGYTKQNIKDAIINCYNDKFHKENNHKHLTLEFITRPDKLERYSQAVVTSKRVTKGKGIGLKAGDFFEDTTLFVSFISEEGTAVWKNTKDML